MDTPTIGRIIHVVYASKPLDGIPSASHGEHMAAIVTRVDSELLWLSVFIPGTAAVPTSVGIQNMGTEPGQWHWPERA